jgi:ribose 5-phosphate isomerase B
MSSRIALAADHAGLTLKAELMAELARRGVSAQDLGPHEAASVDYPDYAVKLTRALTQGEAELGLLICGTGIGMSIAANKVAGIRAALCRTEFEARMARAHNDANVLCLGQRVTGTGLAIEIVAAFLAQPFEGGRHAQRVAKLGQLERAP